VTTFPRNYSCVIYSCANGRMTEPKNLQGNFTLEFVANSCKITGLKYGLPVVCQLLQFFMQNLAYVSQLPARESALPSLLLSSGSPWNMNRCKIAKRGWEFLNELVGGINWRHLCLSSYLTISQPRSQQKPSFVLF